MSERQYYHQQDRGRPQAATVPHDSPEAANSARVIPLKAQLKVVGGATLGYELKPRKKGPSLSPWQMNAIQRRKELNMVAIYRRANGLALGPDLGWAMAIGNMLRVLHDSVTVESLQFEAATLQRGFLDAPAVQTAVSEIMGKAWARYRLYSPEWTGACIELTSVEREEAGVTKIAAIDDPTDDRVRRKNRDWMRRWRAAHAAPRVTKKQVAECLGVSLATLYRMLRRGDIQIADTISVDRSSVSPLSSIDPSTQNVSPAPLHAKRVTPEASS